MKLYHVNELFVSVQGEGVRAGVPHLWLRFARCNLRCAADGEAGFDCDTDFSGEKDLTVDRILIALSELRRDKPIEWVMLTGGEPAAQVDKPLLDALHGAGYLVAMETNGTFEIDSSLFDWVTCSPKTAAHTIRLKSCNELKYVVACGQAPPRPPKHLQYDHLCFSPAFDPGGTLRPENLEAAMQMVEGTPGARLSVQTHKMLGVR